VASGINNIDYPVADLGAARTLFSTLLGIDPYVDSPYYVGYRPGDGPEIGLDPNTQPGEGPICFWDVDDIKGALQNLLAAGATTERPVTNVGGRLIATVRDHSGNVIGITQPSA
jgi:predicted enzyme related to lactoylglutathione lyase